MPETVLRLGVHRLTELRFTVPNYFLSRGDERLEGTTDIAVGIKQEIEPHFLEKRGFDFGVIAGMTIPTGTRLLTSGRVDPFVQMIAFQKIGQNWTLGTAHSIFMPTESIISAEPTDVSVPEAGSATRKHRNTTYQATAILFHSLGSKTDLWAEYAGDFPKQGLSQQIMDFGFVYRPVPDQQYDFRFGVGLTNAADRAFLGVGYSILIGKFFGH